MLFDVLLHVGTLIAICAVYYKDIVRLFCGGNLYRERCADQFRSPYKKPFFCRSVTGEKIVLITVRTAEL